MELVVITPFDSYKRGDTITNPTTMAAVLGSDRARFVVKVQGSGTATIDPANQPTLLELLSALLATNSNLPAALASYGAAKVADVTGAKTALLAAIEAIPATNVSAALNSYGVSHASDVTAAKAAILAAIGSIPAPDLAAVLTAFGASKAADVTAARDVVTTAITAARTALQTSIGAIPTTDVASALLAFGTAKQSDVTSSRNLVLAAIDALSSQPTREAGEVAVFRPDTEGNPPPGWAWLGAASYEDGRYYAPTDRTANFNPGNLQWVQSNLLFFADLTNGYLNNAGQLPSWTMSWPSTFTVTRFGAVRHIAAEDGGVGRLIALAKGWNEDGEDTVVATVLGFDSETYSWQVLAQSAETAATLGVTVPDHAQAFAWSGDISFIRGNHPTFGSPGKCLGVNALTAEIIPIEFSAPILDYAQRFVAANGMLVAVTNSGGDRLVRGRKFAFDAATNTVTTELSCFIAVALDVGDTTAYDLAAPEAALGFAINSDLVISTASGLFLLTANSNTLKSYQIAGPHPLVSAQVGNAFPQRFGSFAGLWLDGQQLRFQGALGTTVENGSLVVDFPEYLASFSRRAYRV